MASVFGEEEESVPPPQTTTSCSGGNDTNNDAAAAAGNFECNICFDLAQDPIVTLCGHLFCWPCLYKWLHIHSHCQECPVCKALVQEERLVPLYGRGKLPTDPRSKPIPGINNIPNRPPGQRPQTAPPPHPNHFPHHHHHHHHAFGFHTGFAPMATARFGNFTLSAAFGGLLPSLFNLQVHGFPHATMYGSAAATAAGFPYGFSNSFHGGYNTHGFRQASSQGQQADSYLKTLLLMVGVFVILALVWA